MRRVLPVVMVSALVAAALIVSPHSARAGLRETFEAGNEAFGLGEYDRAISAYEELLDHGVWDAHVFYNLGTTYARTGKLGKAILNLERALLIDPGHEEALDNVRTVRRALARRRTAGGEDADLDPPRSFWMNVLNRVTASQVVIPFLLCYLGFFGVLSARRLTSSELARLVLLIVSLVLGVAVVAGGGLVLSKATFDAEVREAIAVSEDEATLREGPGERFSRSVEAREGDRLRVLDREGDWIHLRDSAGTEGWGHADDFGELRRR